MVRIILFTLLSATFNINAQEIFRLDFEETLESEGWQVSEKSEWGHELGEDGSNYFRFHLYAVTDQFTSPEMTLESGNYVIYFSWNEVGDTSPDFATIRIKENQQAWEELKTFGGAEGGGTQRVWRQDSVVIGDLETSDYTLQFTYSSTGKYPSQYIGLDNIYLVRRDIVTAVSEWMEQIDFEIYPNPVNDVLWFTLNDPQNNLFDWKIYNAGGQVIQQEQNISNGTHSVDVSKLAKGNYLLELVHENGTKSEQLVIQ